MKFINKMILGLSLMSSSLYAGIENPYTGEYIETKDVLIELEIPENVDRNLLIVETTEFNGQQLSEIEGNIFKLQVPVDNELLGMMYYEKNDELYVLGYAPIFSDDSYVKIDPVNTAIGMMWNRVGFDYDKPKTKEILNRVRDRAEIKQLGKMIYMNLSEDMSYLMEMDIYNTETYQDALRAFIEEIRKEPEWFYLRKETMDVGSNIRLN